MKIEHQIELPMEHQNEHQIEPLINTQLSTQLAPQYGAHFGARFGAQFGAHFGGQFHHKVYNFTASHFIVLHTTGIGLFNSTDLNIAITSPIRGLSPVLGDNIFVRNGRTSIWTKSRILLVNRESSSSHLSRRYLPLPCFVKLAIVCCM